MLWKHRQQKRRKEKMQRKGVGGGVRGREEKEKKTQLQALLKVRWGPGSEYAVTMATGGRQRSDDGVNVRQECQARAHKSAAHKEAPASLLMV